MKWRQAEDSPTGLETDDGGFNAVIEDLEDEVFMVLTLDVRDMEEGRELAENIRELYERYEPEDSKRGRVLPFRLVRVEDE